MWFYFVCGFLRSYKEEIIKSLECLLALIFTDQAPGMYSCGLFVLGVFFRGFGNLSPVISGMAPDTCLKGSSSSLEGKLHSPLTLICSPYITIMKCQLATSSAAEQMSPPNYCCCRVSVFILSRQAVTALAASHHSLATQLLHIWKKI